MKRELLECLDIMKRIGAMNECVYDRILLNEGADVNSRKNAINLYHKTTKRSEGYADKFVRDTLRSRVTSLRDKNCAKFLLGVTRLYLEGQLDFDDNVAINKLNAILYFLAYNKSIVINSNFDGMNLQQLFDNFYGEVEASQENGENSSVQKQYTPNKDYTIVQISNFEEASQYHQYVDWCITENSGAYDHYTSGGMGIFYFCLRNDFKNFGKLKPEEAGENAPLDDYGLSMIAVSVDVEGNYNTCTCRWNHDVEGANDKVLNEKQISNLIGRDFHEVFKPRFTPEELEQRRKQIISREPSDARGIRIIQNGIGQFNFINEQGELLSPKMWFSDCGCFSEGFALVYFGGKWNYIDTDGQLLSPDVWFDEADNFKDGLAQIRIQSKWNFLTDVGDFLSSTWFDKVWPFKNGFEMVKIDGKGYNYLDEDGNLLSDNWFDEAGSFENGFAVVRDYDKGCNYIDRDGYLLSPTQWFDFAGAFTESGYGFVMYRRNSYKIDANGELEPYTY